MTHRSRQYSGGFTVSLLILIFLGCGENQPSELVCEDAVVHLLDCCPGFDAHNVDCTYDPGGCGAGPTYPEISESQSACIRDESCERLRTSGVCARAAAMPAGQLWSSESIASGQPETPENEGATEPSFPQVCP
jgi:hypothetical protein